MLFMEPTLRGLVMYKSVSLFTHLVCYYYYVAQAVQ